MRSEPADLEELRAAAVLASAWLAIASAHEYGFITGGPEIDRGRCGEILERAEEADIVLDRDEVDAALCALVAKEAA